MAKLLLSCWCLLLAAVPALAGQANVFVYHRFGDARFPSTNISTEVFAGQLELLRQNNYTVLTLGEIVTRLNAGKPLPERCAALTVDDAYHSFLTGAMPLLRRHGYPASLFVSTDAVGKPGYLSWDELRRLRDQGVEIGNHSASHPYLLNRQPGENADRLRARVVADIRRADDALRRELGSVSRVFSYPYGEYSPEIVTLLRELGFVGAVAQHSGVIAAATDRYALPRFPMGGAYATLAEFREKLAMRALETRVVEDRGPVVDGENPPTLTVDIGTPEANPATLRCFVQGREKCALTPDPAVPGRYRVRALAPLAGRRGKYTLTARDHNGKNWYWFTQLWIFPQR